MSYVTDALAERLNEILLPLAKRDDLSIPYSEVQATLDALRGRLAADERLLADFDEFLSLFRSYSFDENRACYLQGFKDHSALLFGNHELSI